MLLRFRAEPNQATNLRVRVYSQDRSTLLASVTSGISEVIANSGSYQCEIGALSGFWYVTVDLADSGEVTSDGFANQWIPEVLDGITATNGLGLVPVTVTIQSSALAPVSGAAVTITNAAGTANIAWGKTASNGTIVFALDTGSYKALVLPPSSIYTPLAPQSFTVNAALSVTYTLAVQSISAPSTPGLATVRFIVLDNANPVAGMRVSAELEGQNAMVDSALLARETHSGVTDSNGIVDLTLIQKASFTRGGTYKIRVSDSLGRCSHERRVTVPSLASLYAEDLPDA